MFCVPEQGMERRKHESERQRQLKKEKDTFENGGGWRSWKYLSFKGPELQESQLLL